MDSENPEVTAAACRYLLVALLPRLEALSPGLLADLQVGIESDRQAFASAATVSSEVDAVAAEALRILRLASAS